MENLIGFLIRIKDFWIGRLANIQFWVRVILISFLPILGYFGLSGTDLTSWTIVWDILVRFFSNPYLVGLYLITLYQSFVSTKKKTLNKELEGEKE